jgi:hypothetical protein
LRNGKAHRRRGVPHGGPSLLISKAAFSSPNLRSDPRALECLGWVLREGGYSSRYITGFEVRPVQCLHTATFRACLRVGRDLRALDLLVAAGWNQAPARPGREWSMQAVIGRSCASQPPDWTRWLSWYLRTAGGSPKILGEGSGLGYAPAGCQGRRPRRTARAGVRRRALRG